ncbi:hypothetical protein QP027_02875 [Corynebacterium breve]|uniref:Uncharacterized protein n=1 Tax=Corynebacterium breve TaxID=3049799 RepID=A0ABY8VGZ6_9CORY|nr:hypothetical protein [Corynebacterium breve]WIM68357.1 hypothetical protein QP027_02875 [Corynebacterium breve]
MSFPAVITLWFVNAADVAAVVSREPKADRGFGRKYLAQLNPTWPITPIGQFPLNRSTQPSRDEFYIAGYPGITIVQTFVDSISKLSEVPPRLLRSVAAADVYAFGVGTDSTFAGFAHFHGDSVRRAFSATRTTIFEDVGLPQPFEAPYWAGEMAQQIGGISLPFEPCDLATAAQESWLGLDVSPTGPDINVVAYAVDGRPEPKVNTTVKRSPSTNEAAAKFAASRSDYDDYQAIDTEPEGDGFATVVDQSLTAAQRLGQRLMRGARGVKNNVIERIRHSDRRSSD